MIFSFLLYCAPRYCLNLSVSVSSHVFWSSMSTRCSCPSSSRMVAAKSMRNMEILLREVLTYSCGRCSTFTTFFFNSAESMVRAMRSSSIRYLNTVSYIGFARYSFMPNSPFFLSCHCFGSKNTIFICIMQENMFQSFASSTTSIKIFIVCKAFKNYCNL